MKKILVVGDSIIDRYWHCIPTGISPEAPILNWKVESIKDSAGGAANVTNILHSLIKTKRSSTKLFFVSFANESLLSALPEDYPTSKMLGISGEDKVVIKNRIIVEEPYQQITRFDEDDCTVDEEEVIRIIKEDQYDIGLVSDYLHGTITRKVLETVRNCCKKVVLDPKGNSIDKYIGLVDIITPNKKELYDLVNHKDVDLIEKMVVLQEKLTGNTGTAPTIILKVGSRGCLFLQPGFPSIIIPPYRTERKVIDPTGAGDTFIAQLVMSLCEGQTELKATGQANHLAGISVTHPKCWVPGENNA